MEEKSSHFDTFQFLKGYILIIDSQIANIESKVFDFDISQFSKALILVI